MVDNTEEKGLVKVNDSIFAKIRRFFVLKFGKKQNEFVEIENDELNEVNDEEVLNKDKNEIEEVYEAKEEIERKLMNYYESIRKCI